MERRTLGGAIGMILWGYLLIYFHFRINGLDILPNWIGYILILKAIPQLGRAEPSALLLRPLGIFLVLWEGYPWVAPMMGLSFGHSIFQIISSVVTLYFHFQLLTNIGGIAEKYNCPQRDSILTLRTIYAILLTVSSLGLYNPPDLYSVAIALSMVAIVGIVVIIWLCVVLFALKRALEAEPSEASEPLS